MNYSQPVLHSEKTSPTGLSRRKFLQTSALASGGILAAQSLFAQEKSAATNGKKAAIAISLDLEMAANFPEWKDTHWNFEKGNLTDAAKNYAVEAARRVKAAGGVVHFFLVASALEQENVEWLKEILKNGHSVGNHTYDHVYIRATKLEEVQFKFARAPWLVQGKNPFDVIRENIKLANRAIKARLGIDAAGFRAPGGFANGLVDRPDLQKLFVELGFKWVSTLYPAHPNSEPAGTAPTEKIFAGIEEAQKKAQPFRYPNGLIEIPMAPISDIGAFRNGRWNLEHFLESIRRNIAWTIKNNAVFDFLAHPAVLSAKDPEFKAIDLICELTKQNPEHAEIVNLDSIAART